MNIERQTNNSDLPIVVAVTGASGSAYAIRLIEVLLNHSFEVHCCISKAAAQVIDQELQIEIDLKSPDFQTLFPQVDSFDQFYYWEEHDYFAGIASGSFRTSGMVICPCSLSTLASIANGMSSNLIQRAAEVHLKERRKLIVVPRETPYSRPALENMLKLTDAGGVVLPASPGWYHRPECLDDLVDFVVARICDQLGLDIDLTGRWGN